MLFAWCTPLPMRTGEEEYDSLRCIFNERPDPLANGGEMVEVECISVNNARHSLEGDGNPAYNYELAWYTSGGSHHVTNQDAETMCGVSTSSKSRGKARSQANIEVHSHGRRRPSIPPSQCPPTSSPSSVASSSPFKD